MAHQQPKVFKKIAELNDSKMKCVCIPSKGLSLKMEWPRLHGNIGKAQRVGVYFAEQHETVCGSSVAKGFQQDSGLKTTP